MPRKLSLFFSNAAQRLFFVAYLASHKAALGNPLVVRPFMPMFAKRPKPASLISLLYGRSVFVGYGSIFRVNRSFRHYLIKAKPLSRPFHDGVAFYTSLMSKLYGDVFHAIYNNFNGVPLVSFLRNLCGPFAVFRAIRAIVVDALKRVADRLFPHVFKEAAKRGLPPLANSYASSPIMFVVYVVRIVAPLFHLRPSAIQPVRLPFRHSCFLDNKTKFTLIYIGVNRYAA